MWARRRLEWVTAGWAVALAAAYLVLPRMGSDLSAQVARAGFFAGHGWAPVDLRWYGGVNQLGYSLVSQPVMATLGVRVTGALALVGTAVLLAVLLRRVDAPRRWPAALIGAACVAGNLVSGRVTYGLGVCFGVGALVLLTYRRMVWLAAPLALLAAATSPVAGLFAGLAGAALLLAGRVRDGLLVAVPAAVPVGAAALLFGDGGWMNISLQDMIRSVGVSLLVAVLATPRAVRIGAALSAAGVLTAWLVHTPVGLNATRLVTMFALPVLAAYARGPRWLAPPVLVAVCVALSPVVVGDVRDIGNPASDPAYFRPLRDRLATLPVTGRVEVPPTRDYWEAAYLGDLPLARGWLRQADIDRNPLFFTTVPGAPGTGVPLTAASYRTWLNETSVQYVAVPDTEPSWPGRAEAALIDDGLPYLSQIWADAHWRLYAVEDAQPVVAPPAMAVVQDGASLTFDAPIAGDVMIRVRYYRWLRVEPAAVTEPAGVWTRVRVPAPGRYRLTSALRTSGA
ncbi:hypothetical protein [Actinoplanes sp. NPDC049265]|uniref:hypothetical protein n=1 Tax=Actinoplanes sp. NPDC049265 TaxID=3363902 RepID=UPI003714AA56